MTNGGYRWVSDYVVGDGVAIRRDELYGFFVPVVLYVQWRLLRHTVKSYLSAPPSQGALKTWY